MTVSDNTIQVERFIDFFNKMGQNGSNVSKTIAKNALKNPGKALDITANLASPAASTNHKAALSTLPDVINFYHTGKSLYLGKSV